MFHKCVLLLLILFLNAHQYKARLKVSKMSIVTTALCFGRGSHSLSVDTEPNQILFKDSQFLSHVRRLTRDIDIAILSVRPSVTRWYCMKTAEHVVIVFSPYPIIQVLPASNISWNSDGVTPYGGAKYRWGMKISWFSTNKSLYLANDTRYRLCYYGRRIGTRRWSIKWCHFQWPWTNPNPVKIQGHITLWR